MLPPGSKTAVLTLVTQQQPEKAHTLLTTLVPETIIFYRKPIPAPTPPPPPPARSQISPLVASTAPETAEKSPEPDAPLAIFGSVSATDIVAHIKGLLVEDAEGSRIALEPESIRFVGLEEETDRIKALGRWDIEISVGGSGLEPVRKVIEVLPPANEQHGSDERAAQPAA